MIKAFQRVLAFGYRQHYYKFENALEDMGKHGEFINKELMENQKLQLWALFMQATQGDAKEGELKDNNDQPNVTQSREELNKYEAWKKYLGKPKQEAQQQYAKIVKQILQRHGQKVDF